MCTSCAKSFRQDAKDFPRLVDIAFNHWSGWLIACQGEMSTSLLFPNGSHNPFADPMGANRAAGG
jgi:hypothetical protein